MIITIHTMKGYDEKNASVLFIDASRCVAVDSVESRINIQFQNVAFTVLFDTQESAREAASQVASAMYMTKYPTLRTGWEDDCVHEGR